MGTMPLSPTKSSTISLPSPPSRRPSLVWILCSFGLVLAGLLLYMRLGGQEQNQVVPQVELNEATIDSASLPSDNDQGLSNFLRAVRLRTEFAEPQNFVASASSEEFPDVPDVPAFPPHHHHHHHRHDHPHPPFPPPKEFFDLARDILSVFHAAVKDFYSQEEERFTFEDNNCGDCILKTGVAIFQVSLKDKITDLCSGNVTYHHFCRFFKEFPDIATLAIYSKMKVNIISLSAASCTARGLCSIEAPALPEGQDTPEELELTLSAVGLPRKMMPSPDNAFPGFPSMAEMDVDLNLASDLVLMSGGKHDSPRPRFFRHSHCFMRRAMRRFEREFSRSLSPTLLTRDDPEDFPGDEEQEQTCVDCLRAGFEVFAHTVEDFLRFKCKFTHCPFIQRMCAIAEKYPELARAALILKLKPWKAVVPKCFEMRACVPPGGPFPPPPPPPSPFGRLLAPFLTLFTGAPPPPPPSSFLPPPSPVVLFDVFLPPPPPPFLRALMHSVKNAFFDLVDFFSPPPPPREFSILPDFPPFLSPVDRSPAAPLQDEQAVMEGESEGQEIGETAEAEVEDGNSLPSVASSSMPQEGTSSASVVQQIQELYPEAQEWDPTMEAEKQTDFLPQPRVATEELNDIGRTISTPEIWEVNGRNEETFEGEQRAGTEGEASLRGGGDYDNDGEGDEGSMTATLAADEGEEQELEGEEKGFVEAEGDFVPHGARSFHRVSMGRRAERGGRVEGLMMGGGM